MVETRRHLLALALLGAVLAPACGSVPVSVRSSQNATSSRTNSQPPPTSPLVASSSRETLPSPSAVSLNLSSADTTRLGFSCRLPFTPRGQAASEIIPGFISFPSAEFNSDQATATTPASENRYVQQTVATPVLKGNGALTFDWPEGRWVPASWQGLSADGSRYAYVEVIPDSSEPLRNRTPVHVVDVATGSDRVVHDGGSLAVLDFAEQGIFLTEVTYEFSEGALKVFLLNPDTGAFTTLLGSDRPFVDGAGGGAAWTVDDAPGTTSHTQYRLIGDRLSRVDINGQITPWFLLPSTDVFLIGFDLDGHPIIASTSASSSDIWIAYGPQSATRLYTGPADTSASGLVFSAAIPDGPHGIWFSTTRGVYLYTAAQGMKLVATGLTGVVSGTCG
jgi:hypothetical protein